MKLPLEKDWQKLLRPEMDKEYFQDLIRAVNLAYQNRITYPPREHIFNAFNLCPLEEVRVVILGQDPYHGKDQAHGLSFSVPDGVKIPPSLRNIYQELESDLGVTPPQSGNLEHWAKQGVLLLNSTLTVEDGQAGFHQGWGWERFTDEVIRLVSDKREHVVFILWGKYAEAKSSLIDKSKHLILTSPHPSSLSAHRGFFGSKPFSKTNNYLTSIGKKPIEW
jgi:uracil-DNA glycosylase